MQGILHAHRIPQRSLFDFLDMKQSDSRPVVEFLINEGFSSKMNETVGNVVTNKKSVSEKFVELY